MGFRTGSKSRSGYIRKGRMPQGQAGHIGRGQHQASSEKEALGVQGETQDHESWRNSSCASSSSALRLPGQPLPTPLPGESSPQARCSGASARGRRGCAGGLGSQAGPRYSPTPRPWLPSFLSFCEELKPHDLSFLISGDENIAPSRWRWGAAQEAVNS